MTAYWPAPEVRKIAEELIDEHHPHLRGVRIEYVWREKAATSRGRTVLGKARRVTGLNALLASGVSYDEVVDPDEDFTFFVVEIGHDTWQPLTAAERRALVDHELCHLDVDLDDDGEPVLSIAAHDVEEFSAVIRRHGLWRQDVRDFAEQLTFASIVEGA